jgi:nicotinamidase-related amidase
MAFAQSTALVIVDTQPTFAERNGYQDDDENRVKVVSILSHQVELIRTAKKNQFPILIMENKAQIGGLRS